MSSPAYFTFPSTLGEKLKNESHYSATVKVGNIIKTSGQVGWNLETEDVPKDFASPQVDQAFENVGTAIALAGAKWSDVYQIRTYIVDMANMEPSNIIRNMKELLPNHHPLLTVIGVEKLYFKFRIEIEVEAYVA